MKKIYKKWQSIWKVLCYPLFLILIFYSILVNKNYWEATLYLVMLAVSVTVENLEQIKTSLDRIFYQLYLLNNENDEDE